MHATRHNGVSLAAGPTSVAPETIFTRRGRRLQATRQGPVVERAAGEGGSSFAGSTAVILPAPGVDHVTSQLRGGCSLSQNEVAMPVGTMADSRWRGACAAPIGDPPKGPNYVD